MELIKSQISITLTKGELNQLIAEALAESESSAAIKKVLNPLLADKFPQFPDFTVITLGDTDESGSTQVVLKQPQVATAKTPKAPVPTPIKSIEPVVIDEPVEEPAPIAYYSDTEEAPVKEDDIFTPTTTPYVEPEA